MGIIEKAHKLQESITYDEGANCYIVGEHTVFFRPDKLSCGCPYFAFQGHNRRICSHLLAVAIYQSEAKKNK